VAAIKARGDQRGTIHYQIKARRKAGRVRHALSLYFTFYNWTRIHKTLRVTPAMAAGLTDHLWTMEEIIGLMDEAAPKPGRPKTYNKRITV
jgi:hypothetical protein